MKSVDNNESQQYEEPEFKLWLQIILHPVHPVSNGDSNFHLQLEDSLSNQSAEIYIPTTINDLLEVLVHVHVEPDEMLDHFTLTLELWCKKSEISHQYYETSLTFNLFFQNPVALLSLLARSPVFHKKIHIEHQSFLPILFVSDIIMLHRLACTKLSEIVLIIQYTITASSFDKRIHLLRSLLCLNKLLLLEDQKTHIIHEDNILAQLDVYLDYTFNRLGSYKPSEINEFFVQQLYQENYIYSLPAVH
ncbi:uncharacterized protein CIMG_13216 [Coccidioides immitis RS]|uniref:Uncharacterized protein n=1 Tax=Coccidioides immitis (strain RS) TaxID=246410 RepID=J3K5F7_COCIM|nr:uncharacterized protein CIMG_13216 [Coccidioides immitis RS]EAS29657.3 hypothetical protein CIMG_13216 [Coccidioides immitis RS]